MSIFYCKVQAREFTNFTASWCKIISKTIGGAVSGHLFFQMTHPSQKRCSQKFQKVLMKIDNMADVFLNSANFAQHPLLTLPPPSSYNLNLKAFIKVSKVSWIYQPSYKVLWSSFERKFWKDKLNFSKKTPPKALVQKALKSDWEKRQQSKLCFWTHIFLFFPACF